MNKWLKKGNAWYQAKDFKGAYVSYKKALQEDPSNPEILEKIGNTLYSLERYQEANNNYAETIKCYEAIKIKPSANLCLKKGNTWLSNAQGGSKFKKFEYDQAKICYENALKIEPNFYKALIKLGDVSLFLQEADSAVDCYRRIPTTYLSSYEDNYKKALSLKADQENKNKLTDLIAKGNNEYNNGNLSNAKKYYDELLKYDHSKFPFGENEIKVMKGLAKYCNTTREYEDAIIYAEKVHDLRPNDIDNLYQKVKAYVLSGAMH